MLKNVYAILFGVADGLELGDNMRGYLATAAMHELERIVAGLGGSAGAAHRLAGLGDLITTATSKGSHHHELGRRLARGDTGERSGRRRAHPEDGARPPAVRPAPASPVRSRRTAA